ncbi:MAG: hypothetical protein U5N27_24315 [Rhizobium sp.]|nr:hypothetical protein [Rhizobium sp.]
MLTITHDLALARQMGGDLAVMLEGQIIEMGEAAEVLGAPSHDYTRRLIAVELKNWVTRILLLVKIAIRSWLPRAWQRRAAASAFFGSGSRRFAPARSSASPAPAARARARSATCCWDC